MTNATILKDMRLSLVQSLVDQLRHPSKLEQYRALACLRDAMPRIDAFHGQGTPSHLRNRIHEEMNRLCDQRVVGVPFGFARYLSAQLSFQENRESSPRLRIVDNASLPTVEPSSHFQGTNFDNFRINLPKEEGMDGQFWVPDILTFEGRPFSTSAEPLQVWDLSLNSQKILRSFQVTTRGYWLRSLQLTLRSNRKLAIEGKIALKGGADVGHFLFTIPSRRPPNRPWVGVVSDFRSRSRHNYHDLTKEGNGIARTTLQRAFALFSDWGLDAVDLFASEDGIYVWPHIGFDFRNQQIRDSMKIYYRHFLNTQGIFLSPTEEHQWASWAHAWDLAHAVLRDGRRIGYEFMKDLKHDPTSWPFRFWLKTGYDGWDHFLKKSPTHERSPVLVPATQAMPAS